MQYPKTPVEDVMAARNLALERGLKYVYIGNTFQSQGLNTYCPSCKTLLIERYGINTYLKDTLSDKGVCNKCGFQTKVVGLELPYDRTPAVKLA